MTVDQQTSAIPTELLETDVASLQDGQLKERIGILGGSFNPPHLGHLIMAEQVCSQLSLDQVHFMPTHEPPHAQQKKTIDAKWRVDMTKLAIAHNPRFALETIELERTGKSYTYDTMKRLIERYPQREYYFIIGGDMVENLPTWHQIEQLLNLVTFVGVAREGYPKVSPYPIVWVDSPLVSLSSTEIREKVLFHQSIRYLVPESVESYIAEKGLYRYEY